MDSDKEFIGKDEWTKWSVDIEEKKACTQVQHDGNTAERDIINQEKKKVQPAKCKAGAQTQQTQQCKDVSMVTATESKTLKPQEDQPAMCTAGGKTQNTQTNQATKVKGENDLTSGGMNQEKTEIEVLQRSRQEQPAECKGMAKVPPVQQAKITLFSLHQG
ncbi:uncharacterized protein LOC127912056 isoform X4 [Oncorhynchus keta]|uniref:uncharacterized protein LOC127912056 isoform X3 n=1 Tax=Oncorhynchus keta TaxID=8018 RepID=UPI00227D5E91|nr:uncharacterized protein LOC127912056 isoform X3 [Oncorhynchus keta]XP_052336580.1 uncharacterized protein LOC127912056 isoform X4 [Oncorhynchus keta]XP_052336581.1 uncharacterized protein LOC127912056 isoform X4 [Oncorhynchus keta]XP_052336582.1 uncharacterized protein LOC127912056 isoform X4 [Oncorhynchus keta]XP_052336583.1 uncharacterized protein LOC127912056 isoform X5 [Oncorhynchus keta]XP_052336584.1 uncharacterized protein LOC127912056 isoform X3 [Oncorhynchus keta]XP_052336585.1 un